MEQGIFIARIIMLLILALLSGGEIKFDHVKFHQIQIFQLPPKI